MTFTSKRSFSHEPEIKPNQTSFCRSLDVSNSEHEPAEVGSVVKEPPPQRHPQRVHQGQAFESRSGGEGEHGKEHDLEWGRKSQYDNAIYSITTWYDSFFFRSARLCLILLLNLLRNATGLFLSPIRRQFTTLFWGHTRMYHFTRNLVRGTSWCYTKRKTMVQV